MFRRFARGERGFTMIEMMVVLIIIAVLIGVGIRFYFGYIENARVTKARTELTVMAAALDAYYAEEQKYPGDTDDALKAAGIDVTQKNPWGVLYNAAAYEKISDDEYYLRANDGQKDRVEAHGVRGKSEVKVLSRTGGTQ